MLEFDAEDILSTIWDKVYRRATLGIRYLTRRIPGDRMYQIPRGD